MSGTEHGRNLGGGVEQIIGKTIRTIKNNKDNRNDGAGSRDMHRHAQGSGQVVLETLEAQEEPGRCRKHWEAPGRCRKSGKGQGTWNSAQKCISKGL